MQNAQLLKDYFEHLEQLLVERLMNFEQTKYLPSALETKDAYLKRRELAIKKSLACTFDQAQQGYTLVLKELGADPKKDLKPFMINMQLVASYDPKKPLLLYETFGWNKEMLRELYAAAQKMYERKSYADAVDAYSFLTTISPLMPEFWTALAAAYKADNRSDVASDASLLALYLEGKNGTS